MNLSFSTALVQVINGLAQNSQKAIMAPEAVTVKITGPRTVANKTHEVNLYNHV